MPKIQVSMDFNESSHLQRPVMLSDKKQVTYEASFFTESPGSKKSVHRGPEVTIIVEGKRIASYELVIGDDGVPKLLDTSADPVTPAFAQKKGEANVSPDK